MSRLTPDEQLRIALRAHDNRAAAAQHEYDARRRMILTAHRKGLRNDHIADLLGLDQKTVGQYVSRWKREQREAGQADET